MNHKTFLIFLFNIMYLPQMVSFGAYLPTSLSHEIARFLFLRKKSTSQANFYMLKRNYEENVKASDFRIDYWQKELVQEKKKEQTPETQASISTLEEKIQQEKEHKTSLLEEQSKLKEEVSKQVSLPEEKKEKQKPSENNTFFTNGAKFFKKYRSQIEAVSISSGLTFVVIAIIYWMKNKK